MQVLQDSYRFKAGKSTLRFIGSAASTLICKRDHNFSALRDVCHRFPPEKPCVVQCCLGLPLDPFGFIQGGISLQRHEVLPFLQSWFLGVAIEATRGLKSCRADWEIGHVICPWNIMWHNMTPGHLYVKVNISAWQLDKSGQGSRHCGFILACEQEVLWLRVAPECVAVCVELLHPNLIPIDIVSWLGLKRRCLAPSFSLFKQEEVRDSLLESFRKEK